MKWEPYDPRWLVALVKEQYPGDLQLAAAVARCTQRSVESPAYSHFVDPKDANKPGAEWQFDQNIVLESEAEDTIVLDVLKDGRIGGAEFLSRISLDS